MLTDCAARGIGGATKFRVVALSVSVDGAGVTTSVTGTITGATPETVMVTLELYVFATKLVGFTRTVSVPGTVPLAGPTVTHRSSAGVVAVNVGVPELALTVTL